MGYSKLIANLQLIMREQSVLPLQHQSDSNVSESNLQQVDMLSGLTLSHFSLTPVKKASFRHPSVRSNSSDVHSISTRRKSQGKGTLFNIFFVAFF